MKFVEILFLFVLHCPSSSFFIYKGTVCLFCDLYTLEFLKCKRRAKNITRFFKLRKIYSESEDVQWINRQHLSLHRPFSGFVADSTVFYHWQEISNASLFFTHVSALNFIHSSTCELSRAYKKDWCGKYELLGRWQARQKWMIFSLATEHNLWMIHVTTNPCWWSCLRVMLPPWVLQHLFYLGFTCNENNPHAKIVYFWMVNEWNRGSQTSHRQAR